MDVQFIIKLAYPISYKDNKHLFWMVWEGALCHRRLLLKLDKQIVAPSTGFYLQ